jgi:hypothetical protein
MPKARRPLDRPTNPQRGIGGRTPRPATRCVADLSLKGSVTDDLKRTTFSFT